MYVMRARSKSCKLGLVREVFKVKKKSFESSTQGSRHPHPPLPVAPEDGVTEGIKSFFAFLDELDHFTLHFFFYFEYFP